MDDFSMPCRDCGPGYVLGGYGCRHGDYQPEIGEASVCRTCCQPIWWEEGEIGHRTSVGWSDRIKRGGDSVVCFKSRDYRHVPMGGREEAIYNKGLERGRTEPLIDTPDGPRPRQPLGRAPWLRGAR